MPDDSETGFALIIDVSVAFARTMQDNLGERLGYEDEDRRSAIYGSRPSVVARG
jgi:hypothetical protein